ncbi:MAG: hypothetical protein Q9178_007077 [Gyalolechia marmorata]
MASGLVFVSAKALVAHPSASASSALLDFVKANKSQLTFYDYQHLVKLGRPAGLILAIVDQYSEVKDQATNQLQPLPPVPENAADDEELEPIEEEPSIDSDVDLPEEQDVQLMDDEVDEWVEDCGDQWEADYPDDHDDQIDAKNIAKFDPDLDPEKEFFSDDAVNAWVKADWDECRKGAKPRFYERFDVENIEGPLSREYDKEYVPSPLTSSSPLGPHLLIYQVPTQPTKSTDADFLAMFHRYAFLTNNERYRRCSAFKQHDPDLPRWLMVQEFGEQDFAEPECGGLIHTGDLKKRQAEYWWRKNGWEGVRVGIFQIRKGEESKEEMT